MRSLPPAKRVSRVTEVRNKGGELINTHDPPKRSAPGQEIAGVGYKFSNFAHVEQNSAKASGSSALHPNGRN